MEGCEVVTGDSPNDVKENYDSVKKTIGEDSVITIVIE